MPSGSIIPRPKCSPSSRDASRRSRSSPCSRSASKTKPEELAGLPELRLEGLSDADARELLASASIGPLDERVRDRIMAETRGNPLALLELPRGLSPKSLAGGFALPDELPLPSRIEASFRLRVEQLPTETQRLLLVAAAEPIGDSPLLWGERPPSSESQPRQRLPQRPTT